MHTTMTTMIGSIPAADIEEALGLLERFPLVMPAWPQLPKRGFREGMIVQFSEGFPGIRIDDAKKTITLDRGGDYLDRMAAFYDAVVSNAVAPFATSAVHAAGLHAFIERLERSGTRLPVVKGQVVGPFTFGLGLDDAECKAVWFDEQYRDIVLKGLAMKGLWQAQELKRIADRVVIFYDEPIFSALGTPTYIGIDPESVVSGLSEIAERLHAADVKTGVHCCGNMEWSLLARTSLDYIAFDAYGYGDKVTLYAADMKSFMERGGTLAWGIVPTGSSDAVKTESGESLQKKIVDLEDMFVRKEVSRDLIRERRIYTPSCGMGNLTMDEATRVLHLLSELT